MENDTSSAKIGETPHVSCHKKRNSSLISGRMSTRSSYESADSGYITITPHSGSLTTVYTPVAGTGCRLRSGCSTNGSTASLSRRRHHHRMRTTTDLWQSERASRYRSKFNHSLDASEGIGDCSSSTSFGNSNIHNETRDNQNRRSASSSNNNCSQSLSSELEGLLRAQLRSGTNKNGNERLTSVPTTPASTLHLLSPPPSPPLSSPSFVITESIQEDVEMKLVTVPQSTPHLKPTQATAPDKAVASSSSPTTSRPTPSFSSSLENRNKMSKLMIADLAASDIRPKRLDFSQRPKYSGMQRSRALPDHSGKSNVDFMSVLGEESDHCRVVSKILALLSPKDLCSMSMVSKTWRRICSRDSKANTRRLKYVILRQNVKENLKLSQVKAKIEGDVSSSPKSRYARKGFLAEVQNLLSVPASHQTPTSPPVSPSKVKFHSFVKAGRTLEPSEHLLRCPRCSFAACHVDGENNIATCTRQGCSMEFCMLCSSKHTGPCKTALLATPTKRNKRLIAGSRQSKRNLRRL